MYVCIRMYVYIRMYVCIYVCLCVCVVHQQAELVGRFECVANVSLMCV
jgi:hypothetical protein